MINFRKHTESPQISIHRTAFSVGCILWLCGFYFNLACKLKHSILIILPISNHRPTQNILKVLVLYDNSHFSFYFQILPFYMNVLTILNKFYSRLYLISIVTTSYLFLGTLYIWNIFLVNKETI